MAIGRAPTKTSWVKGQTGNPSGRPKTEMGLIREKLETVTPSVLAKVIAMALDGDLTAAKLVLDRTMPSLKPTDKPVSLDISPTAGMATQAGRIFAAGTNGTLTTEQAAQLLASLANVAAIVEVNDLAKRIAALEDLPTRPRRLGHG